MNTENIQGTTVSGDGSPVDQPEVETTEKGKSLVRFPNTDSGNAERLAAVFGHQIQYCYSNETWYRYVEEEGRWQVVDSPWIKHLGRRVVRQFRKEASSSADFKFAEKSEDNAKLNNMMNVGETLPELRVSSEEFDQDPWLLNTQNRVINLQAGEVREHDPEDKFTRVSRVGYDPKATAPRWKEFLQTTFDGDEALIEFVQKAVGYAISGSTEEQCMFVMKGDGANGKSTFLETLRSVLGEYAANTPVSTLLPGSRKGHDSDLARLPDVRFLTVNELERGEELQESKLKRLVGQDTLTVRDIYDSEFEFTPDFTLFMMTNFWPNISVDDQAVWRRLHPIPFPVSIPKEEQDPKLAHKLLNEGEGILNWALEGFKKWTRDGFEEPPEAVIDAKERWRGRSDREVSSFIRHHIRDDISTKVRVSEVHKRYRKHCLNEGVVPLGKRDFNDRLEREGYAKDNSNNNQLYWFGIELREELA
ncbi:P4 family phage/plasmid primase-like protein [Salinibacter ruber]|uniref:DNA primase family protein n=1 Tax=Salinibacter ruber TaxID=146919 RepID=UPI00216A7EB4|nr:phage/plasmid primase, P4 family [Salinibacter ruber]MCS3938279.1 P4 family phage/plasmid primase-like protein [Salinibacter ruber]